MNYFDVLSFRDLGIAYEDIASVCLDATNLLPCGATIQCEIREDVGDDCFRLIGYESDIILVVRPGTEW